MPIEGGGGGRGGGGEDRVKNILPGGYDEQLRHNVTVKDSEEVDIYSIRERNDKFGYCNV